MELVEDEEELLKQFDKQIEQVERKLLEEITIDNKLIEYFGRIRREVNGAIFFLRGLKRCIEREQTNKPVIKHCLEGFETKIRTVEDLLKTEEALKAKKSGIDTEINKILNLLQKIFSALQKRIPQHNV